MQARDGMRKSFFAQNTPNLFFPPLGIVNSES